MATMLKLYQTDKERLAAYKEDCKRYGKRAKLHWHDKSIETIPHDYVYRSQETPEELKGLRFDVVSIMGGLDVKTLPEDLQTAINSVGA